MIEAVIFEAPEHASHLESAHQPRVPAELGWFIERGLRKDATQRYPSLEAMVPGGAESRESVEGLHAPAGGAVAGSAFAGALAGDWSLPHLWLNRLTWSQLITS